MKGLNMRNNVKKKIETKQNRLNRFVTQGRLSQQQANEQVLQYAKLVCSILGG
jgi:hypothetical protein